MTTANEYRQYARECVESARAATSEPVRQQFLDIAKLWLTAAARMDTPLGSAKEIIGKVDGHHAPASLGVAGPHEQS
jgi:hypothetical protein